MCRLFGLHAGHTAIPATFWLLDAPDSLSEQSRQNPDGAGIGVFGPDGMPTVDKQPLPAWQDSEFATAAHRLRGTTFVAHVRYASTGARTTANTHPFRQDNRLFAHNGVVAGLAELDARLDQLGAAHLVAGQTDSERVFALITAETARHRGDLEAGLIAAVSWIGAQLPLYAVNLVLTSATDLWALRYPDTHDLYVLDRPPGGTGTSDQLNARSDRIRVRAEQPADSRSVIVATERMDDDPGWRPLGPGELLHVDAGLALSSSTPFAPPQHLLELSELTATAAASQHPAKG